MFCSFFGIPQIEQKKYLSESHMLNEQGWTESCKKPNRLGSNRRIELKRQVQIHKINPKSNPRGAQHCKDLCICGVI